MKQTFQPTAQQIAAAKKLFICMALNDIIKKEFANLSRLTLEAGDYRNKYYGTERRRCSDEFIRDPQDVCQIVGIARRA